MQQLMFMKNLSVVGGLLVLFAFGAGSLSLDARRAATA
jgi:putative oxidoreductase